MTYAQGVHAQPARWKQALVHEVIEYWIDFVLAKVIMVGDILRLGRGLEQKPLIVPTLHRTVVFSVWVGLFSVLEATVPGCGDGA